MDEVSPSTRKTDLGLTFAVLLLRLWLGIRALVAGIEKFAGTQASNEVVGGPAGDYGLTADATEKVYGFSQYHGVPEALYAKFSTEPLIPEFALKLYDLSLGPLLILLGLTLLLGVATRISLFAMGLLYTSLTVGLILLKQDAGVAWLGIHIGLIALALIYASHNRCCLFLRRW